MIVKTKPRRNFRADINGLRAWAVVAVILYHFGVPGFAGGFIGVDVFFVISGFLMTGIVVRGLERGQFSAIDFYMARARRILPALMALCATLLALGWIVLLPPDYKMLASHSVYSLSFLSNVEFWREAGYFDAASHEKWLLHTWSLAVEWQFYLMLPIASWCAWRMKPGRPTQLGLFGAGFVLSFGAAVLLTPRDGSFAFYMLPTRAWEMLAGGLVFLLGGRLPPGPRLRRAIEAVGLALIVACVAGFDHHTSWPGWRAAIPVGAAMLVLLCERDSRWTGNGVATWLGDRSYSLYLWHWPVYVALVYVGLRYNALAIAGALVLTLALGHLSYQLVERPSRAWLEKLRLPRAAAGLALAAAVVLAPALAVWARNGVAGRLPPAAELAAAEANDFNPRKLECHASRGESSPSCVYGKGEHELIVLGDSHADAILTGVVQAATGHDTRVMQWSYSGCPVVDGLRKTAADLAIQPSGYRCSDFISWVDREIEQQSPNIPVVLINRYAAAALGRNEEREEIGTPRVFFSHPVPIANADFLAEFGQAITESACTLARHRTVYMVRPIPEMGVNVPKTLSRRMTFGIPGDLSVSMEEYRRRNAWVWAAQDAARDRCGIRILDPLPYLCKNGRCYASKDGMPLYHDDNHLSGFGNKLLAPMYLEAVEGARPQVGMN